MSEFTRGEWTAYPDGSIDVVVDGKIMHCYLDVISADDEALEANARLIAAAPEMYELLSLWALTGAEPVVMNARKRARELLERIDGAPHE